MTPVIDPPLTADARARLGSELAAGERLLWSAQPRARHQLGAFGIWVFAIPWTVFALVWESFAIMPWFAATRAPDAVAWGMGIAFPLFGLPFILVGLYMLLAPFRAIGTARRTIFAITDRRIIAVTGRAAHHVKSVPVTSIGPIDRTDHRSGYGRLSIQTHSRFDSDGDRITDRFVMQGIPNPRRAEQIILDQQRR